MRVVEILTVAIIASFALQALIPGYTEAILFELRLALSEPWRFFTSIFLHGSFAHIFLNLFALLMFGSIVEARMGSREFLKIFFLSGIGGSLLYWLTILVGIIPPFPALGASGAIYGIMAAAAVFYPNLIVYVWFFPMRMREALVLWVVLTFLGSFNPYSGVADAAHLGGIIVGYLYAKAFRRREAAEWWMNYYR